MTKSDSRNYYTRKYIKDKLTHIFLLILTAVASIQKHRKSSPFRPPYDDVPLELPFYFRLKTSYKRKVYFST